jgi:hypothetical protein
MPDAAQFTLALFDSTGLGTSVQAPARVPASDTAALHGADAESPPREPGSLANGSNYILDGDRALARGWIARPNNFRYACRSFAPMMTIAAGGSRKILAEPTAGRSALLDASTDGREPPI